MSDMGRYGTLAARHMARWRPSDWAAIEDHEGYFRDLDDQITQEIDRRASSLAPPAALQTTDYVQYVGQLQMARHMAESEVLAEMAYLAPEPGLESEEYEPEIAENGGWVDPGWVSPRVLPYLLAEQDLEDEEA